MTPRHTNFIHTILARLAAGSRQPLLKPILLTSLIRCHPSSARQSDSLTSPHDGTTRPLLSAKKLQKRIRHSLWRTLVCTTRTGENARTRWSLKNGRRTPSLPTTKTNLNLLPLWTKDFVSRDGRVLS